MFARVFRLRWPAPSRIDTALEVGAATESVTVEAAAPLLKTEGGEVSHNIATQTLDDLPILTLTGAAASGGSRQQPGQYPESAVLGPTAAGRADLHGCHHAH